MTLLHIYNIIKILKKDILHYILLALVCIIVLSIILFGIFREEYVQEELIPIPIFPSESYQKYILYV